MAYSKVAIENIFQLRKGRKALQTYDTQIKESKRYIQIKDLRSDDDIKFAVDPKGVEVLPADICIAWDGANAGTIGYGLSGFIGSTITRLRLAEKNKYFTDYIGKYLQSKFYVLNSNTTGATIPHISKERLLSLKIPIPPLREQKRIAAILDKADAIRRKREEAIQLADEFLRSVFLDMFGDPVLNPNNWPEKKLLEVTDIKSGVAKGRKLSGKETVYVPYMRVANVQDGHINIADVSEIEVLLTDVEKYHLEIGDLLLTEGGDPDKLGRGAVWKGEIVPCIHQNHIFRVRSDKKYVLPEYLSALIGSFRGKRYFLKAAKQTTGVASINMTQLKNFGVLMPPLSLQIKYCKLKTNLERVLNKVHNNCKLQNNLFNSLSQRAFHGDLYPQ